MVMKVNIWSWTLLLEDIIIKTKAPKYQSNRDPLKSIAY